MIDFVPFGNSSETGNFLEFLDIWKKQKNDLPENEGAILGKNMSMVQEVGDRRPTT